MATEQRAVACIRCGAPIDVSPGPDMPEDGSGYRVWHCPCGLVYDLGRQDGQGYIFLRPESVAADDDALLGAALRELEALREENATLRARVEALAREHEQLVVVAEAARAVVGNLRYDGRGNAYLTRQGDGSVKAALNGLAVAVVALNGD